MAYIPTTVTSAKDSSRIGAQLALPTSGVYLSDGTSFGNDAQAAVLSNYDVTHTGLCARGGAKRCFDIPDSASDIYSITKYGYNGRVIFHRGTKLYSYAEGDEVPTVLYDGLSDKRSIFVFFLSKLYIYCDMHVYSVDDTFAVTEEFADAPTAYENVLNGNHAKIKEGFVPNLLSPRITLKFQKRSATVFSFPALCDVERRVEVYVDGERADESEYTLTDTAVRFKNETEDNEVQVVYYVAKSDWHQIGYEDILYNCDRAVAYGGNTANGTRLFFSGDGKNKGKYYISSLKNPLNVDADSYEIIGDGCENITGFMKMYGSLMVFTEKSVFRMSYDYDGEKGAIFSVKELNSGIGCDIPDSIELIDNRVVFANSDKGVFIIDSGNELGEHNIKPISGNILKGRGKGFLDNTKEERLSAFGVDFGRKYMLCVADRIYIWDYDKSAFSDAGSYSKAQNRLIWYMYEGVRGNGFAAWSDRLMIYSTDENTFISFGTDNNKEDGFSSSLLLDETDFSLPVTKKSIVGAELVIRADKGTRTVLSLYSDGEKYYSVSINAPPEKMLPVRLSLPAKALYRFSLGIDTYGGGIDINGISVKYKIHAK